MAYKRNALCKVCTIISQESDNPRQSRMYKLVELFLKDEITAVDIGQKYGLKGNAHTGERSSEIISRESILTHAKKHQSLGVHAKIEAAQKRAMRQTDRERLGSLEKKFDQLLTTVEKRNALIEKGMEGILSGKTKVSAAVVAKALKDVDDVEAKKTDQGMEMMKMFNQYVSGELADPKAQARANKAIEGAYVEGELA